MGGEKVEASKNSSHKHATLRANLGMHLSGGVY